MVSWQAPAGDAVITGYTLHVSDNGTSDWAALGGTLGPEDLEYSHTGLHAGTTKHYRVQAYNNRGSGTWSTPISATLARDDDNTVLDLLGANVSAGVVLANSSERLNSQVPAQVEPGGQFTRANLYLALDMMPNIRNFENKQLLQIDPIVNIRLSSVGLNTSTGGADSGFGANAFIQSQKAATIHLGSVVGKSFPAGNRNSERRFKWSIGAIGRYVLQSITDSEKALRIWDVDDLYMGYSIGGRFSLLGKRKRGAWAPVFYVDVSRGKFENFEMATPKTHHAKKCAEDVQECRSEPSDDGSPLIHRIGEEDFDLIRPSRTYIESRLYLRGFHFGFDLNNGTGHDGLRFIFGVSANLGELFARIVQ